MASIEPCAIALIFSFAIGVGSPAHAAVTPQSPEVQKLVASALKYLGEHTDNRLGGKCLIGLVFIKAGRPVVLGRMPRAAEAILRATAAQRGAPIVSVAERFGDDLASYPHTNLEGDYQRWNAATATLAAIPRRSA